MRLEPNPLFREECGLFELRFTCRDCAHFDLPAASCAHGYPVADHLDPPPDALGSELVFCKEFELR